MRRRFYNSVSDSPKCMIIEALEDGLTVSLEGSMWQSYIEYSTDYITWNKLKIGQYTTEVNKGEQILFRGRYSYSSVDFIKFVISKNCELKGSCMYLLGDSIAIKNNSLENYTDAFRLLFENCTTIKSVSSGFLPATTLSSNCYYRMFYGCSGLTTAPELPATTLVDSCYYQMFYGCEKLNYIKAMFTTTPSTSYTSNWVSGVASTGKFIKNGKATWNVTGVNGIPSGWSVVNAITFTIGGTEYQAEEGMTWGEWVDSEYNTIGASISGTKIMCSSIEGPAYICTLDGYNVLPSDIILHVGTYKIKGHHAGGGAD